MHRLKHTCLEHVQAELAKFPGLEGVHTEIVRQEGFCIAQFESSAAARNAHDTICAGNSQVSALNLSRTQPP